MQKRITAALRASPRLPTDDIGQPAIGNRTVEPPVLGSGALRDGLSLGDNSVANIRIGLIGCGVVGQGVMQLLSENGSDIEARLGAPLEVRRIVVNSTGKNRGPHVDESLISGDADAILNDPDIDIVVEVMGGIEEAGDFVRKALTAGKSVVTANKALLAYHGQELFALAESTGADLYFEAAVAGGVPIIRVLREALTSDRVDSLRGIINGTSNYILSRMQEQEGLDFGVALREAQEKGYAEADPGLDVGGGDAAHKLTILANLAFGTRVSLDQVPVEGIDTVSATDMKFAKRFGFAIKPLGVAQQKDDGSLDLRVHPALVDKDAALAHVNGALNAVYVEGAGVGPCMLSGYGAGGLPTAVSVLSDIVDVARNIRTGASGRVKQVIDNGRATPRVRALNEHVCRFYLRFSLSDQSGILGELAGVLGEHQVSIEQMVQDGDSDSSTGVSVVVLTHPANEGHVRAALSDIDKLAGCLSPTRALRIEEG